jgi:hypothetical protein
LHLKIEKSLALTRDFHLTATTATTATTKTRKYWSLGEIGYIYKSIRVYRKIAVQLLQLLHLPKMHLKNTARKKIEKHEKMECEGIRCVSIIKVKR